MQEVVMAAPGQGRAAEEARRYQEYQEKEREERERLEREEELAGTRKAAEAAAEADEAVNVPPAHQGDILGLSDAPPDVEIPQASRDHGGHPAGIEVRQPTTGTAELKRSKGATGIDMGAAGSGTDLDPNEIRPRGPNDPDE
jgi:hypothetical protein